MDENNQIIESNDTINAPILQMACPGEVLEQKSIISTNKKKKQHIQTPRADKIDNKKHKISISNKNKLNPRQRAFITAYTDPDSKTFGNQTQSYLKVYKGTAKQSAEANSNRLINNDKVNTEIERVFEQNGLSDMVIIKKLSNVILGKYRKNTVTLDKEGNIINRTISDPSVNELVKVSEAIWKVRGVYDKNKAQVQVAEKEYSKLMKEVFSNYREAQTK